MDNSKVEKGYTHHLNVSKSTFKLVNNNCKEEFLKQNPQFKNINITHNFMVDRIARYYLGERF